MAVEAKSEFMSKIEVCGFSESLEFWKVDTETISGKYFKIDLDSLFIVSTDFDVFCIFLRKIFYFLRDKAINNFQYQVNRKIAIIDYHVIMIIVFVSIL